MTKFGGVLPFLPKILSIAKALPLQIHPNKDLAAQLHAKNPDQFTDDNHKPEISIALGKFEVFIGWKATEDIQALFDSSRSATEVTRAVLNWGSRKSSHSAVRRSSWLCGDVDANAVVKLYELSHPQSW